MKKLFKKQANGVRLKDSFREIRHSFGRFFSVLIIIALGCGFFTGLKATKPDMILTAESYFEKTNLMDLRLRSSIGVKSSEIAAVRSAENVTGACAGYSKDLFYSYDNQNVVLKAFSLNLKLDDDDPNNLNKPELVEGRLPENKNECVVEKKITSPDTFKIGEKLTLSAPDDEELSDTLATDTYEIVGIVLSPLYIGYERDSTTIGNGTVTSNIYLLEEAFVCDYYTDLYVSLDGVDEYDPFSVEYEEAVEKQGKAATEAFEVSVQDRYDDLKADVQDKINSAQSSVETLEQVLECNTEQLSLLYEQSLANIEELNQRYEDAGGENGGSKAYLIRSQLLQMQEKAKMLSELIADTDGSKRREYTASLESTNEELETAKSELANTAELKFYNEDRFSSDDYSSYQGDANKIDNLSNAFPLFFVLIAALVCLTAMTRMVEEQRTLIGTYKALGYTSRQILTKYLLYCGIAAVVGSCAGSCIGLQVFPKMIINTYKILYNIPDPQTPFRPVYMIGALVVSLVLTCTAVIVTLYREIKEQPAEIMRPKPPKGGKRVFLERFPKIWNKLGFLMKVTIRNLLRYKKRFLMTLVGVSGCTALIITGFGLKYSISSIVDLQFGDVFEYSAIASLNTAEEEPWKALDECGEVTSYVPAVSVSGMAGSKDERYSMTVISPRDSLEKYIDLRDLDGNKVTPDDSGVIITKKLANMCGLSVGGTVYFSDTDGNEYTAKISAIVKNYALNYMYMSGSVYSEIFGKDPEYNIAIFNATDDADESAVKSELIADDRILGASFKSDSTEGFINSIESLNAIILLLIVCAAFLAITVLYNLTSINITERRREIATIKVLGFYNSETSAYIYRENIISTIIGVLVGLGLGKLLHYFVVITVEVEAVLFNRHLVWWAYLAGAVITVLFAVLVNITLHFKLKKIDMAESLKSVE